MKQAKTETIEKNWKRAIPRIASKGIKRHETIEKNWKLDEYAIKPQIILVETIEKNWKSAQGTIVHAHYNDKKQ